MPPHASCTYSFSRGLFCCPPTRRDGLRRRCHLPSLPPVGDLGEERQQNNQPRRDGTGRDPPAGGSHAGEISCTAPGTTKRKPSPENRRARREPRDEVASGPGPPGRHLLGAKESIAGSGRDAYRHITRVSGKEPPGLPAGGSYLPSGEASLVSVRFGVQSRHENF